MKNHTFIHSVLVAAVLCASLTACGDNGSDDDTTTTTTNTTPPATATDPSTSEGTTDVSPTDPSTDPSTDPDTTNTTPPDPSTTTTTDPVTSDPTTTNPTGEDPGFNFMEVPFDDYVQIDRHGAVEAGTAGIRASAGLGLNGEDIAIRDDYNASNPEEDAAMMWFGEIAESVTFFHDALDDDIMGLGLVPATIMETVAQAGPVILPDTIKYDPKAPVGYPNGRALTDQVVDLTLAAVLIKLGPMQPLDTFAKLPLNPKANDVPFKAEFPFLAPPHLP